MKQMKKILILNLSLLSLFFVSCGTPDYSSDIVDILLTVKNIDITTLNNTSLDNVARLEKVTEYEKTCDTALKELDFKRSVAKREEDLKEIELANEYITYEKQYYQLLHAAYEGVENNNDEALNLMQQYERKDFTEINKLIYQFDKKQ